MRQAHITLAITDAILQAPPELRALRARAFLVRDIKGRWKGPDVEGQMQWYRSRLWREGLAYFERMRPKLAGLRRDRKFDEAVVRTIIDGADPENDAVKAAAEALKRMFDAVRRYYRRLGIEIGHVEGYFPQSHNQRALLEAGFDRWYDDITARLDLDAMVDAETGKPFTPKRLREVLREVYDDIVTRGAASQAKPKKPFRESIVDRLEEERFFKFKSANDWIEYNRRYGDGDPFDTVVAFYERSARRLAQLDVLGPWPGATVRAMKDVLESSRQLNPGARQKGAIPLENVYAYVSGQTSSLTGEGVNPRAGSILASARSFLVSAKVSGAWLSALMDVPFGAIARQLYGGSVGNYLRALVSLLARPEMRDAARQLGVVADAWLGHTVGAARMLGEVAGSHAIRTMNDVVFRLSWLTPWTEGMRYASALSFWMDMTDKAALAWRQLPEQTRAWFERFGIDEKAWDVVRRAPREELPGGIRLITPFSIERADREAARAFHLMSVDLSERSTPVFSPHARLWLTLGAKAGTITGEVARTLAMVKFWPIAMAGYQITNIMAMQGLGAKYRYVASLVLGTMAMGALSEQLYQISRGRKPADMDKFEFWKAAIARSGALGLVSDFFLLETSDGRRVMEWLAGPGFSTIARAMEAGSRTGKSILEGDPNFGPLVRQAEDLLPGGRIWYLRLVLERELFDRVEKLADPKYAQRWARQRRYIRERFGSEFWAAPGRPLITGD